MLYVFIIQEHIVDNIGVIDVNGKDTLILMIICL